MGTRERHERLYIQWLGLHTSPTSGGKSKITRRASKHQEFYNENTKGSHGETCRQPSECTIWNTRRGRAVITYIGCSERHKPVVARHNQSNTMSPMLEGHYKTHGKTHHSVPTAGKQLTTLNRVLR